MKTINMFYKRYLFCILQFDTHLNSIFSNNDIDLDPEGPKVTSKDVLTLNYLKPNCSRAL
jgi:hypothetical protein